MHPLSLYRISLPVLLSLACLALSVQANPARRSRAPSTKFRVPGTQHGGKFGLDNYDYCQAAYPEPTKYKAMSDKYTLVHLQVMVRHGDRTPLNVLSANEDVEWDCGDVIELSHMDGKMANDRAGGGPDVDGYNPRPMVPAKKNFPKNAWKRGACMLGQLTSKGVRQHIKLGRQFRKIYVDKLGYLEKKITRGDIEFEGRGSGIYVRSSHHRRTIQSGAAFMSGLYPAKTARASDAKDVPIHFYSEEVESLLLHTKGNCPRLNQLMQEIKATDKYQRYLKSHAALRARIDSITETKGRAKFDQSFILQFDALRTRTCHAKKLPCNGSKCLTTNDALELNLAVSEETMLRRANTEAGKEFNRLTVGFFLGELHDRLMNGMRQIMIEAGDDGTTSSATMPPRFELFSSHDDTVYGMIAILMAKDVRWPPYASNLIFELHRKKDGKAGKPEDHVLRILYNGQPLKTDLCDMSACPLPKFLERINKFILRDSDAECELH